ncbi:MAG TPA: DUF4317 domain-containing protein [Candidatus Gemmiger avium]|nr:DUF4317 domain-containing protein [Candidatus Gemmiger avium]
MNKKEISELRRRFNPDDNAIGHIYGCYINTKKEIIAYLDESLSTMPPEEAEKYLGLLKKALSGRPGKNLIDIVFSTQQVADSPEHKLLMSLRDTELKEPAVRQAFYDAVIQSLDMEGSNYLVLLAHDAYDVPFKRGDSLTFDQVSDTVFHYVVCCVCPVKEGKSALGFYSAQNEFHNYGTNQIVAQPELGFVFPAFDDRAANIYNALFYTRKPDQIHQEFIDGVFHTDPPMSAAEQRETFETALSESLGQACSLQVVQSLHEWMQDKITEHKENREEDPLTITAADVGAVLQDCQVPEAQVQAFLAQCEAHFGKNAVLNPANLIPGGKLELETETAKITLDTEAGAQVEAREIDGRKYLLLPADGVTVNGMAVQV